MELPPTEIVASGHGLQAWWLFHEPWLFRTDAERQQVQELVRRFGAALQEKAQAHGWRLDSVYDLARVLRVPGTWNCKADPVPVRALASGGPRYAPADFQALLPQPGWTVRADNGALVIDRARMYVSRMPGAISGQRGHDATWAVAQVLVRGFGLSVEQAQPILEEYSERCQPPWSAKKLEHKLTSAAAKSRLPVGYLLNGDWSTAGARCVRPAEAPATDGYSIILRYTAVSMKRFTIP